MSNSELDHTLFGNQAELLEPGLPLAERLERRQQDLRNLSAGADALERARLQLDIAELLLALERKEQAWTQARDLLAPFIDHDAWQEAVETCNVLFQCEQPASLQALGQGVWLAVSFPIMPQTTIAMLNHIIDETPPDSDGAAVAAITSHYIADLRASDEKHESLTFLTGKILADVAKRHSNVETQEQMDFWLKKLQLNDPGEFLPRLATVIDVLVQGNWWFDRDAVRARLPVN